MRYLLDTGVLLRLVHPPDALHQRVRAAVRELRAKGHTFVAAAQNLAEFWNVCTRPPEARGGLGMTVDVAAHRLRIIERFVTVLSDTPDTYAEWRGLVVAHSVKGVQVHDARLVAVMRSHSVSHIFTLNGSDFSRYSGVTAEGPDAVLPANP